jgi:hypothetical protein
MPTQGVRFRTGPRRNFEVVLFAPVAFAPCMGWGGFGRLNRLRKKCCP